MRHPPEGLPTQEQERIERLKKDFCGIFDGLSVDLGVVDSLFKKIAESYQAEERAYHTLEHIDHLLSFLRAMRASIKEWRATQLAAWFYDAVYDTRAQDNEEQSAELARRELTQLGISNEIIDHVEQMVRATAKHQVIEGDDDSAVPDEQYRAGRKRILESFMTRPRIYYTETAHTSLDSQARKNLQREIQQLG